MARTHSSFTASPARLRSPLRSPTHGQTSEDGSQYEMDLDALGLNSTFDSTVDEADEPKVDVVDTSDIDGPEDFTMNMTYWMTADLPLAQVKSQIKSRKEAKVKMNDVRGDARRDTNATQDHTEEGDAVVLEPSEPAEFNSASLTMRVNGTNEGQQSRKAISESSMENDEKVRSYLSALPDADIGDAVISSPLRVPRHNVLQVPSSAGGKARSLQATVEDCDTPRKPTQQTVIHHARKPSSEIRISEADMLRGRVSELESRLEHRELASKTRIMELETILSYTRSELEAARDESYKQRGRVASLEEQNERQKRDVEAKEAGLAAKMEELGEELRLQNLTELQTQREDFDHQLTALEDAKHAAEEHVEARGQLLEQVKGELNKLKQPREHEQHDVKGAQSAEQKDEEYLKKERAELLEKLSSVQERADGLQAELEKATTEAKAAREAGAHVQGSDKAHDIRISDLELDIQSLQSQLDAAQAEVAVRDELLQQHSSLESRMRFLEAQLQDARTDIAAKDDRLLRLSDMEARFETLQQEMNSSHMDADQEFSQTSNLRPRVQLLQSQLESARADVIKKDKELLRNIEEQEKLEQNLNASQGRIESLETTISTLRQQLAEAHRDSAKSRTDVERFEQDLEDVTDRLQDARAEADRRVADVEKKLSKMKELKTDTETKWKILQSEHDELVEENEAKLEDVRSNAEDAVRKAGMVVEQERTEKRRLAKELKKANDELEKLRTGAAQKAVEDESEDESVLSPSHIDAKEVEMENLRTLLRKQAAALKTIRSESTSLKKENARLRSVEADSSAKDLEAEVDSLRRENESLKAEAEARNEDFEAVNKAMDERLATMLSKVLKERARTVVGKRDGQWAESVNKVKDEKELMGKVLLREWGRQEVGVAEEGEKQGYRYKYVKRS